MDAIEKAVSKCRAAGLLYCAVRTLSLKAHNEIESDRDCRQGKRHTSKVVAIVHGFSLSNPDAKHVERDDSNIFTASASWNSASQYSTLSTLGVRADAHGQALQACYEKFETCAYLETSLLKSNSLERGRYYTEAQAIVMGIGAHLLGN
jgi:hypothetical protein